MSDAFNHLLPSKDYKIPNNIEVDTSPFSHLLPNDERQKFKLTTKGNRGSNLTNQDLNEPDPFDHLMPKKEKLEDIDDDTELWQKVKFAAGLGFTDTYRGVKQMAGFDEEKMKADQKKLYEYMQNEDGSTNWAVASAYFGSALLDPAGWLIPVTKARTLYKAAKYGFVSAGIVGGLGYVDEESILDTRAKQAAASAVGGVFVSPLIAGIGKKIKGEKVFTRESLGIPGFDTPSIKTQSTKNLAKIQLQNEAGMRHRDAFARKKIEIDEPKILKDIPQDRTKLLRGPRSWFREVPVKAYQEKFGKPALNYLTNGEYGAEAGGALTGAVTGYAFTDDEASTTTKFGRAFTGALIGALGIGAARKTPITRKFGPKGEEVEITETLGDWLGRGFIDGYKLPKNVKALKAEAQGFSNHLGMKFSYMANKIQRNLTPDEQKILINILEGDTKLKVAPAKLQELSIESRKLITEMAQEYVDMGLISPLTFKRNKDTYLKRSYKGKLEDRPFGEELKLRGAVENVTKDEYMKIYRKQKAYTTTSQKQTKEGIFKDVEGRKKLIKGHRGWELLETSKKELKKLKKNDMVRIRWEYTKPQRVGLGEIEDAAFAIAETGRASARTLAQYRFFANLSKQDYVYDAFGTIPKEIRKTYMQMPTTVIGKTEGKMRYGNLSGKWVPQDLYKSLVSAKRYYEMESADFYKQYRTLNSYWKVSKTAWNPTVHVNNIMSNFVLHDLVDADYKFLKPAWKALTTHGKKNKAGKIQRSELVEAATKHGVFDADLITTELKNIQKGTKFPYNFNEKIDPFNNSVNTARNIFDDVAKTNPLMKLTEWYRFEDSVFRLSVFQDRLSKGWSMADAALDARKSFIDYNIDAPAINWMRNTITPFLAYTYRVIPILAETAIVRPWKYFKWGALGYGLNQMGDIVSGGDQEAERAVMPERKQGHFFGMPFLPHRNIKIPVPKTGDDQQSYYVDLTRWVPGGDVLALEGTIPGLPAPLQPSGGLAGEVLFPLVGYDLFRQEKIKGQTGIAGEDWKVRLDTLKDKLIPNIPFLPGSYSSKKLESARKGLDSPFRPDQSEFAALANTLGFKIEYANLDTLKTGKVFELKRKIDGFKEQMNVIRNNYRKGLINKETAQMKIEKIANKIRNEAAKYEVYFEKADYAEIKEPFEKVTNLFEKKN